MDGYQEFSFDQGDDHVGEKTKRWKGEKDRVYRFSLIWWKGLEDGKLDMDQPAPSFVGAPVHFIPDVGYIVNQGPEYTKLAGEPPRMRIATAIVVWPTDKNGVLQKDRIKSDAEVLVWVFSNDKYSALKQIHREFPFGQHDIMVNCKDAQYQKLTISPCKENLLRKLAEKGDDNSILQQLIEKAQQAVSSIHNEIGRKLTIAKIREKMAGGDINGASLESAVSDSDLDDMVDDLLDK